MRIVSGVVPILLVPACTVFSGSDDATGAGGLGEHRPAAVGTPSRDEPTPRPPAPRGDRALPDTAGAGWLADPVDVSGLPPVLRPSDDRTLRAAALGDATAAFAAGDPARAAIALEGTQREGADLLALAPIHAWALLESGQSREAEALARQGVEARDGMRPAWSFVMAESSYRAGNVPGAASWYRGALAAAPEDPHLLLRAAETALAVDDPEQAVADLDRLALRAPLGVEEQRLRAKALSSAGRTGPSLDLYQQLLASAPEQDTLWDEAGMAAFQGAIAASDGALFEDAARSFSEASALDPQNPRYQFNLGCALDWSGDPTGAEAAYQRALELQPGYMKAVENLVELLVKQERAEEAKRVLREQLRQPLTRDEAVRVERRLTELATRDAGG